ncbi:MAG: DUF1295 domain-containing protein [bacterium]|nr:DUF1295 domain-containing protein [bacterium]
MEWTPLSLLLTGWFSMASFMVILYVVQRLREDAGIVDVGWATGLAALAVFYGVSADGYLPRRTTLLLLAGLWGLRLGGYLFLNRVRRGPEDGRYQMLRNQWGDRAQTYFFFFFQIQALWAVMFSLPFLVVAYNPLMTWTIFDTLAIVVWIAAIAGESTADAQLAAFRSQPENRGKTCREGLWRYSRHPNYFFEFLHWWSYVLLGVGSPYWWVTLTGPATMLLFLYKITGIPYTEKQALASRGEEYREYQRTTSPFIPWFPKEEKK